jgi:hypothetical protein
LEFGHSFVLHKPNLKKLKLEKKKMSLDSYITQAAVSAKRKSPSSGGDSKALVKRAKNTQVVEHLGDVQQMWLGCQDTHVCNFNIDDLEVSIYETEDNKKGRVADEAAMVRAILDTGVPSTVKERNALRAKLDEKRAELTVEFKKQAKKQPDWPSDKDYPANPMLQMDVLALRAKLDAKREELKGDEDHEDWPQDDEYPWDGVFKARTLGIKLRWKNKNFHITTGIHETSSEGVDANHCGGHADGPCFEAVRRGRTEADGFYPSTNRTMSLNAKRDLYGMTDDGKSYGRVLCDALEAIIRKFKMTAIEDPNFIEPFFMVERANARKRGHAVDDESLREEMFEREEFWPFVKNFDEEKGGGFVNLKQRILGRMSFMAREDQRIPDPSLYETGRPDCHSIFVKAYKASLEKHPSDPTIMRPFIVKNLRDHDENGPKRYKFGQVHKGYHVAVSFSPQITKSTTSERYYLRNEIEVVYILKSDMYTPPEKTFAAIANDERNIPVFGCGVSMSDSLDQMAQIEAPEPSEPQKITYVE